MQGNTANGMQDISADQYITTITQTSASFVEHFHLSAEQMECSDGANNDQSLQFRKGLDQYVSFDDCSRACQVEDQCNGMIEVSNVCSQSTTGVPALLLLLKKLDFC